MVGIVMVAIVAGSFGISEFIKVREKTPGVNPKNLQKLHGG